MAQTIAAPSRLACSTLPLGFIHQPMWLATQGTMKPVRATLKMLPMKRFSAHGMFIWFCRIGVPTQTPHRKTMG